MAIYYCNQCSTINGKLIPANPNLNFTGSLDPRYSLLEKFEKHTIYPAMNTRVISVFNSPVYDNYKDLIIHSWTSGSIEIDNHCNENVLWVTPAIVGYAVQNGNIIEYHNSVKLVKHKTLRIHAYSTGSFGFYHKICFQCGSPAF